MVGITTLWLPILLSAVFVFVASSILHMVLPFHRRDYDRLPGEDNLLEAIRKEKVAPGDYFFPFACGKEFRSEETMKKFERGPVGIMTVRPSGPPAMGPALVKWFVYVLVIGILVAYVTGRTLGPGVDYLQVFRVSGTVAFLGFAGAVPVDSIWKGVKWSTSFRFVFDGLVYALIAAGTFGWLWPS